MSWSTQRMGRAGTVGAKLAEDMAAAEKYVSDAGEKKIVAAAAVFVTAALAEFDPAAVVTVSANGSAWQGRHSVAVNITPHHEFVD